MLLVQPEMGQLKKAHNVMSSAPQFPLIIPHHRSRLRFLQEAEKTEGKVFIRSRAAFQLPDCVLLTYTDRVSAESEKGTRGVTRFVQVTVFFKRITDSVW